MRENLSDPLPLARLASAAAMSKYHFVRVFRELTGLPPQHFLTALRLEAALRLLATTGRTITDICFSVGYSSHGTFTREFTRHIGVSPRGVRSMLRGEPHAASDEQGEDPPVRNPLASVDVVLGDRTPGTFALIGAFSGPMVCGFPEACAATSTDCASLTGLPPGRHFILAVEVPALTLAATSGEHQDWRVGAYVGNPLETDMKDRHDVHVTMRPIAPTDPPLLSFLPLLLRRYQRMLAAAEGHHPREATEQASGTSGTGA